MFTILLTLFGLVVFLVSLIPSGFKTAFRRLLMFIITGSILDAIMFFTIGSIIYFNH